MKLGMSGFFSPPATRRVAGDEGGGRLETLPHHNPNFVVLVARGKIFFLFGCGFAALGHSW